MDLSESDYLNILQGLINRKSSPNAGGERTLLQMGDGDDDIHLEPIDKCHELHRCTIFLPQSSSPLGKTEACLVARCARPGSDNEIL